MSTPTQIRQILLNQVRARGIDKTICPSEVARALTSDEWRSLMPLVRSIAAELVNEGAIVALQKGQIVDPLMAKGPIRLRITEQGMQDSV